MKPLYLFAKFDRLAKEYGMGEIHPEHRKAVVKQYNKAKREMKLMIETFTGPINVRKDII